MLHSKNKFNLKLIPNGKEFVKFGGFVIFERDSHVLNYFSNDT